MTNVKFTGEKMGQEIKTIQDLSKILNLSEGTVRCYLSNYRFNAYSIKIKERNKPKEVYIMNDDFIKQLFKFLYMRQRWGAIKLLGEYCNLDGFKMIEEEEENDDFYV